MVHETPPTKEGSARRATVVHPDCAVHCEDPQRRDRGNPTPAGYTNRFTVRAASAPPGRYSLLLIAVGADRDTIDRDQGSPTVATPPLRRGGLFTSGQPSRHGTSSTPIDGSFHQCSHQIRNGQRCNGDRQNTGEEADHSGRVASSHHERDREDESTASDGEESMSFGRHEHGHHTTSGTHHATSRHVSASKGTDVR
jgi:hypothetical protein